MTADAKKNIFFTAENNSARKGLRYKKNLFQGQKAAVVERKVVLSVLRDSKIRPAPLLTVLTCPY